MKNKKVRFGNLYLIFVFLIMYLPVLMVLPDVMMGASFLILFSFLLKIPMGFYSVLLSHIAFSIPIVVLMVLPRLYALNPDMIKAAEDLGANDMTILNKIILPNI